MPDIQTAEDVRLLVDSFYRDALRDPEIGPFFTEVAQIDLEAHLPKMYAFWESILFKNHKYRGNAFAPHMDMHRKKPLTQAHFARWLQLFEATVDRHFEGVKARMAKDKARQIANMMQQKISRMDALETTEQAKGGT